MLTLFFLLFCVSLKSADFINCFRMRNIIIKIPTFIFVLVFVVSAVVPTVLYIYYPQKNIELVHLSCRFLLWVTFIVWVIGLVEYFSFELNSRRYAIPVYLLLTTSCIASIVYDYYDTEWISLTVFLVLYLAMSIVLTMMIKKVFYARSTWFLLVEFLFVFVGFLTLTSAVKEWEDSEKI